MARLIFVNRYFFPDHSATSQILSDLAFHLTGSGHEVHVLTSGQIYDAPSAVLPALETVNGVQVHRLASTRFGRGALPGRAIDYLSFYRSVYHHLITIARPSDIVIATTDPPLLSVAVAPAVRRRGARLVNWLQDIYPETAAVLGVPLLRGPLGTVLTSLRNRILQQSASNVVVGDLMAQWVLKLGVPAARVHVIANWCNDEAIKPQPQTGNPLRPAWDLVGKFIFGYSGNLGRAHEYDTVLEAAKRLRRDPRIVFLMIGGGKRFEDLAKAVKAHALEGSFRFLAYQEQALLPHSLSVPDVHWLSLQPQLEGLIVPSKFYGIAAAGRPMVMIGDPEGEIGRLVQQHGCGVAIAPGNAEALARTLKHWSNEPQIVSEMGLRARQMLEERFSRLQALARWRELFM